MLRNPFEDPEQRRRVLGYAFIVAVVLAPFLGLLFGRGIGLLVAAIALGVTAFVAFDAIAAAPAERRARIQWLAVANAALALLCLITAIALW